MSLTMPEGDRLKRLCKKKKLPVETEVGFRLDD